jgi:chitosanase
MLTRFALGAGVAALLAVPPAITVAAGGSGVAARAGGVAARAGGVAARAGGVAARAGDEIVLSRGRSVMASSGSVATTGGRWDSADGPGTQWLRVDLGATRGFDRVRVRWERAYARSYRVQASADGANWTDVFTTRSGDGGTDDLATLHGRGRYVRILATQRGRSTGGYAIAEFQVYGQVYGPVYGPAGPAPKVPENLSSPAAIAAGLDSTVKRETAFELVASAENSTLNWRREFAYIEDIHDGRGYTGGIIGFCSGTSDMLAAVAEYTRREPRNVLAAYLPALRKVDGSDSHAGLDPGFPAAWKAAARDPVFQRVQDDERDRMYFDPAVRLAERDGLRALGQFAYYDAAVMHGLSGLRGIRATAMRGTPLPAQGGDEITYLGAFLDARVAEMRTEEAHSDTTRVDTAQRRFLAASNLDLVAPLSWKVYGDTYRIGS